MDFILNSPLIFKVSFWRGLPKTQLFSFLQEDQVKPVRALKWASRARAAVRRDYETTVGKGSATQGRGGRPDLLQSLPDGLQAPGLSAQPG